MKRKTFFLSAFIAVVAASSGYFIGVAQTRSGANMRLAGAQAIIGFNHFIRYRELAKDLADGCEQVALQKTRISMQQELGLLSDFYKEHGDTQLNVYINKRAPEVLTQIKDLPARSNEEWVELQCESRNPKS